MPELPMFPLGSVLVPTMVLPLHVFEPRYRAMMRDCLDADRQFGVVLIERGSEVGGDDVRTDVGTVASIEDAAEFDDGRWAVMAVGRRRIRVAEWLPDDPYPRAVVEDWPDPAPVGDLSGLRDEAAGLLRRALALKAELGEPAPPSTVELDDDPVVVGHLVTAMAPLGPMDRQRLLAAPTPDRRLGLLVELLTDETAVLQQRLALG